MPEREILTPGALTLRTLRRIAAGTGFTLEPSCRGPVDAAARTVEDLLSKGDTVYGVNTGFGRLARTRIPDHKLRELQRNLVLSHAAGTGPGLDDDTVHLILALKAASLARGHSGVRQELIDALLRLADARVYPCIPAKGSVGASGDLAPLAHLSAVLLGVGEATHAGRVIPASEALSRAGLAQIDLGPKEGLALLNGTQVSTALALRGLLAIEDVLAAAVVAGALSLEAAMGSHKAFDARIHDVRGQPGQTRIAAAMRELLRGSAIEHSHADCDRVQDPYSLRCQPQVLGACLDHLEFAAGVLRREANAVSDNPLVFPADGQVLSGGNFHAEPVAMAADVLAITAAEIGALAERRVALLMDASLSGLPSFVTTDPGTRSGFMIAHVTAAALASENKLLAHPASVDSLPTSANQEDHVSMATHAARRISEMADNTGHIVAIELLAATQGVELHAPLTTSPRLQAVMSAVRERVTAYADDRPLAPDIATVRHWIGSGAFRDLAGLPLPSSE